MTKGMGVKPETAHTHADPDPGDIMDAVRGALGEIMVRRTHDTATGGFVHAPCDVEAVEVEVPAAECGAYFLVRERLLRLLPPLLQLLHMRHLSPEEERQRSQMLKSCFELLRRGQAVFWSGFASGGGEEEAEIKSTPETQPKAETKPKDDMGPVGPLPTYLRRIKDTIVARYSGGVFVTCFWKEPLKALVASLKATHPDLAVASIDGDATAVHRGNVVLAVERGDVKVVFMTTACALSVTFTNLRTVLVVGACLNASQQEQAVARVVGRIGQTARTTVQYFNAVVVESGDGATALRHRTIQHAIQFCHACRKTVKEGLLGDVVAGSGGGLVIAGPAGGPPASASSRESTSLLTNVLTVLRG